MEGQTQRDWEKLLYVVAYTHLIRTRNLDEAKAADRAAKAGTKVPLTYFKLEREIIYDLYIATQRIVNEYKVALPVDFTYDERRRVGQAVHLLVQRNVLARQIGKVIMANKFTNIDDLKVTDEEVDLVDNETLDNWIKGRHKLGILSTLPENRGKRPLPREPRISPKKQKVLAAPALAQAPTLAPFNMFDFLEGNAPAPAPQALGPVQDELLLPQPDPEFDLPWPDAQPHFQIGLPQPSEVPHDVDDLFPPNALVAPFSFDYLNFFS